MPETPSYYSGIEAELREANHTAAAEAGRRRELEAALAEAQEEKLAMVKKYSHLEQEGIRADMLTEENERLKSDLSAGLGPEETVFLQNENAALEAALAQVTDERDVLKAALSSAGSELGELKAALAQMTEERNRWMARVHTADSEGTAAEEEKKIAQARLDAALALHKPWNDWNDGKSCCRACAQWWPCPTHKELTGGE